VADAMALVKNRMPKFDTKILRKDLTVDDTGWVALVDSAYDTAQYFVSLYDFSVFFILMTMPVLAPCNIWSTNCNKLALNYKSNYFC
jgi:hypothetical protein